MPVFCMLRVPLRFEFAQGGDDLISAVDRIETFRHLARMRRPPRHAHGKPDNAGIGAHQHFIFWFRAHDGISPITAHTG